VGVERKDLGSWLNGPILGIGETGEVQEPGVRLGLPASGPGSVAGIGRRIVALFIDWIIAVTLVSLVSKGSLGFGVAPAQSSRSGWVCLVVFFFFVTAFTGFTGASLGQRFMKIVVARLDGSPIGLLRAVVRTFLLCLVIPAVFYDRDRRGFHDKAVGTLTLQRTS